MAGREADKRAKAAQENLMGENLTAQHGSDKMEKGTNNPDNIAGQHQTWEWEDDRNEDVADPGHMGRDNCCW